MQSTQLGLGTLPTGANLWKVDYEFGELQTNGTVDALKNSGNIARQTLTVPGTSFVQSYTYDSLYRLTEAIEKIGTTTNWSQQFGYDRYGNRTSFAQDIGGIAKNTTPAVDANTNRFTSTDFGYDANGNIVEDIDEMTSLPREFIFNGDNKQTEVKRDGVTIGRYYYDGEGRRVKKVTDTETTVFVYAAGQLVAEYSTEISQTPKVSYTTADHLGSPRVITTELGQVSSRRDFMPFGEELYAGVGTRTGDTGLKYSSADDDVRQKFTGYQKDNETNLDFAEARMYANNFGRFTAVDPLLASGKSSDPQSFNRFVYTMNSPLRFVDPSGKIVEWVQKNGEVFYDSRVADQGDAIRLYGQGARFRPSGHEYKARGGSTIKLGDGGNFTQDGKGAKSPDRAPKPEEAGSPNGYIDINFLVPVIGAGANAGVTGGVMIDTENLNLSPYFGGGAMTGFPFFPQASVTSSPDSVSGGLNIELAGSVGPISGNVGVDASGNPYQAAGAGASAGPSMVGSASVTVFYVFNAPHPEPRPLTSTERQRIRQNSSSNTTPADRPRNQPNCSCNPQL